MKQILAFSILFVIGCSPKTKIVVNHEITNLSVMYQNGEIEESEKKEALFSFSNNFFLQAFVDMGLDYRIKDNIEAWKLFENREHFILIGTVYESENKGFGFVWVLKDNIPQNGNLNTVFFKVGDEIISGNFYPKGIIPN